MGFEPTRAFLELKGLATPRHGPARRRLHSLFLQVYLNDMYAVPERGVEPPLHC